MDPVAPLIALVDTVGRLGPGPALLAAGIVGMTLAVILLARLGDVWGGVGEQRGAVVLQAELIRFVEASRATEEALRKRLDAAERDRSLARDAVEEQRMQLALLRNQRRRLISMLREVIRQLPEPATHARGSVT